mmetsp:Transcript_13745/g.33258  ORF Transcript_13745/g.33258 Transcript_13745/m.33258 type:complete len:241 (+) Transcript_13745:1033-1755(+)
MGSVQRRAGRHRRQRRVACGFPKPGHSDVSPSKHAPRLGRGHVVYVRGGRPMGAHSAPPCPTSMMNCPLIASMMAGRRRSGAGRAASTTDAVPGQRWYRRVVSTRREPSLVFAVLLRTAVHPRAVTTVRRLSRQLKGRSGRQRSQPTLRGARQAPAQCGLLLAAAAQRRSEWTVQTADRAASFQAAHARVNAAGFVRAISPCDSNVPQGRAGQRQPAVREADALPVAALLRHPYRLLRRL